MFWELSAAIDEMNVLRTIPSGINSAAFSAYFSMIVVDLRCGRQIRTVSLRLFVFLFGFSRVQFSKS